MTSGPEKPQLDRAAGARRDYIWVAVLVFVGLAARLYTLGNESLWTDELATLTFSDAGPVHAVISAMRDTGPPLYYILQSMLLLVVPASEVSLRIIPAVAGALTAGFTYLIGRRLYSRGVALLGVGFVAVGYITVSQSQEARAYSLTMLIVAISCWLLLRLLERPTIGDYVWYAVSLAAAAYSQLFGAIAAAGIVLGVLLRPRLVRRLGWRWGAALGSALVVWLPWVAVLVKQVRGVAGSVSSGIWRLKVPRPFVTFLYDSLVAYAPWGGKKAEVAALFVVLLLVGIFAVVATRGRSDDPVADDPQADGTFALDETDTMALMASWVGMVFVGSMLVSRLAIPIFHVRYAIVAAPAIYLSFARGLSMLWRPVAVGLVIAMLVLGFPQMRQHYAVEENMQYREATQYLIDAHAEQDGLVVTESWTLGFYSLYAKMLGDADGLTGLPIPSGTPDAEARRIISEYLEGRRSVYVAVTSARRDKDLRSVADRVMQGLQGWRLVDSPTFRGPRIDHYVRDVPVSASP